jgi:hypothetical protein
VEAPVHVSTFAAVVLSTALAAAADEAVVIKDNYFVTTPRLYARLIRADPVKRELEFADETDGKAVVLPFKDDVEFLRHWAPASAEDFVKDMRCWVWLTADEKGKRLNVRVVADEITAMAMHRRRYRNDGVDSGGRHKLSGEVKGSGKTLELAADFRLQPKAAAGKDVVVQTTLVGAERALLEMYDADGLEEARRAQLRRVEQRLAESGIPAVVNLLFDVGGEVQLTVGRFGQRWARALRRGDKVELVPESGAPAPARVAEVVVRGVQTRMTLVAEGRYLTRFRVGGQASIKTARPSLPAGEDPPDVDRVRSTEDRVIWLMSQVYCACPIAGDRCAGDFLTLWSCNHHNCGRPRKVRTMIEAWIRQDKSDGEMLKLLRQSEGPDSERFHLRP